MGSLPPKNQLRKKQGLMDNTVIDIVNKSSVMKVGKVISVEGRTVKVLVRNDQEKNAIASVLQR